ncbi:antibiotic biosynthesis monooxygenase [Herbaspirillum rhizosphaerae]|uniref:Antibiotic biosynthesis monooxygenase n=1 Tax=Herbaspirillum rhizosphaerae TaxID=346179 RepID=A0ABW8ZAH5_9BURK
MNSDQKPDMVTIVIQHDIRTGSQSDYEQWLKRILPIAAEAPGHRGVNVIKPPAGTNRYTVTIRFETLEYAEQWLASPARRDLIREAAPLMEQQEKVDTITGLEFWFTPPAGQPQKRAKPWKQFLLTLSVIYPLTLVLPWLLGPVFGAVPVLQHQLISKLIAAAIIVGLMTYVIMPRYTRLAQKWLFN